jgi:hypothetical protein
MPGCPYCHKMHSQLYVCDAMKAARAKAERMAKVQPDMAKDVSKTVDARLYRRSITTCGSSLYCWP